MTFSSLISGTIPHHNKYSSRQGAKVTRVIQHHWASNTMAGEATLADPNRKASVTYLVYTDGTIKGQVPEEFRPWTSGGPSADNSSITIECQDETMGPEWRVSDAAISSIVRLLADIATRYGFGAITTTNYMGHKQFAATACPGPYLWGQMPAIRASVNGGAPVPPVPPTPPTPPAPSGLTVDGQWGGATTKRLQQVLGTPVDGVVSHQYKSSANQYLYAAQFDKTQTGSTVIRAIQARLGLKQDGLCGKDTISAMQRHFGTPVDGVISSTSTMVQAMQRALNAGTF